MKPNPLFAKILVLILISVVPFQGCGRKSQQPAPQQMGAQTGQQPEKAPDQLKSLENSIEKIIKTLNGPSVGVKDEEGDKKKEGQKEGKQPEQKGQEDKKQGQDQGDQQKAQGGGGQQSQQQGQTQAQAQTQAQPPAPQDPWEKITPVVNTLHYQWNSYMPAAVKAGAGKNLVDSFSTALNSLTNTVIGKNQTNTLMAASYLYAYVPDFYGLYKTKTSPEIKRVRHYIRNAMLNAKTANWVQADTDLNNLKSTWSLYKNAIPKEQQENMNKLDSSIYEFEKVLKQKEQPLSDIKGRVALSNVESLEKGLEEQK